LLTIPPVTYVPVLVGAPLNRDRKVPCPFHDDRTPSLHAYGPGRGWRCFGCGAGGSIFDLAARLWGLGTRGPDFRELRQRLAETFDLPEAASPPR
jgi:DNA primase